MVKINLLYVQKTRRKKKGAKTQYQLILAGLVLAGALAGMGYGWVYLTQEADRLRIEKEQRTTELTHLKAQVVEVADFEKNKKSVQEKIGIIEQLQRNQTIPILLLNEISERLPERVWLTQMTEQSGEIKMDGKATGNSEIVAFIDALKQSRFFENIEIEESRQVVEANIPIYTFKLKWRLRPV
jgi:type IV pilus assembly protein PilN